MQATFIGGGNMASALVGGLLRQGWPAAELRIVEVLPEARMALASRFGVAAEPGSPERFDAQEVVVLAVKPQHVIEVAHGLRSRLSGQLVVSIAAGIRTRDLSRWLGGHEQIVRVMPNTPALVLAGISSLFAMPAVPAEARARAERIVSAVGTTLWVEREELMDAVTAVSGSGPAYVFYFMEAVMRAAEELGLTPEQAHMLTLETFFGAASLARQSKESPAMLRVRVTSKGGTTERAVGALEAAEVRQHVVDAVKQAAERSHELGEQFGRAD